MAQPIPYFELRTQGKLRARGPHAVSRSPAQSPLSPALSRTLEFFCDATNGSNLNSGTDTNAAARYTTASGNWNGTNTFTVADGSNASNFINVGDYVSVYANGSTATGYIAKVTALQNQANGTITLSTTAFGGSAPSSGTGTRTLKAGGAWKGPNGADLWPLSAQLNQVNVTGGHFRINFKTGTYSITSGITMSTGGTYTLQGYSTVPGDGGRATLDGGSNAIVLLAFAGTASNIEIVDFVFSNNGSSGSNVGINMASTQQVLLFRCIIHDIRGKAISNVGSGSIIRECEFYNCCQAGGDHIVLFSGSASVVRSYFHDNTAGSNGIVGPTGTHFFSAVGNIFDGLNVGVTANATGGSTVCGDIRNNTFHNCAGGVVPAAAAAYFYLYIENNIFTKITTAAFEGQTSFVSLHGRFYNNCYGRGTYGNLVDYSHTGQMERDDASGNNSRILLPPNVSPYVSETTGDYRPAVAEITSSGRGTFTQTGSSKTGTISYPDIGAVQHLDRLSSPRPDNETVLLPTAYVNYAYLLDIRFDIAQTLSIPSGSLPPGLTVTAINSNEAQISGTPTGVVGTNYAFVLRRTSGSTYSDSTFIIPVLDDPDQGSAFAGGY